MTRLYLAIAAPYAALWVAVVWWYPALRGDALLWLYGAAELAGGVFVAVCLVVWACGGSKSRGIRRRRNERGRVAAAGAGGEGPRSGARADPPRDEASFFRRVGGMQRRNGSRGKRAAGHMTSTTACTLALTSASLATTLLPALQGPAMIAGWPTITTVWCVALGIVLGVQGWELLR